MHTPTKKQKQQQQNAQLTKHDAFVYWSSSCAVCWWPIFRKLGTYSTTDALSPRTLLTENICESVHQILQHSTAEKKEKKTPLNSPNMMRFFTGPFPVKCGGGRRPGSLADATQDCSTSEDFSPRTVLTKKICRCRCESVHQILQQIPAEKKKEKKTEEEKNSQLTKYDAFLYWSSTCPTAGGRRPGSLADATQDCSTSEDFSPRTVLTKNICRCGHHILQHFTTTMPFLTVSAITCSWMAWTAPQADSW